MFVGVPLLAVVIVLVGLLVVMELVVGSVLVAVVVVLVVHSPSNCDLTKVVLGCCLPFHVQSKTSTRSGWCILSSVSSPPREGLFTYLPVWMERTEATDNTGPLCSCLSFCCVVEVRPADNVKTHTFKMLHLQLLTINCQLVLHSTLSLLSFGL